MDDRVPDLSRAELDRYPVGVITLARDGTIVHYNRAEAAFSRLKPHDVVGRRFFGDVAPCASVRGFQGRFEEFAALAGDGAERFDFAFDFAWGRHDVTITMLRRAERDEITLLVKTRSAARRREAPSGRAGDAVRGAPDAAGAATLFGQWVEEDGGRTWWSPEVRVMFGLAEDAAPQPGALRAHVLPEDRTRIEHALAEAGASEQPVTLAYRIRTAQGDERSVVEHVATLGEGGARRRFGTILDVTERERHERRLWRSAHHDVLTGLPNRKLVLERLSEALQRDEPVALLFLDLDRFKHVNDTAGHAVGDALLRLVASRLASCVRPGDTVARLNGDEFLILLPGVAQAGDAEAVAESVLDAVAAAVRDRRRAALRHGQHRARAGPARRGRRRRAAAGRRHRHVPLQGARRERLPALRRARSGARPARRRCAGDRAAPGDRPRGVRALLPAHRRRDQRARSSRPRPWCAGTIPSAGSSARPTSSRWPSGPG